MLPSALIVVVCVAGAVNPVIVLTAGVIFAPVVPVLFSVAFSSQFASARLHAAVQSPSFCV